MQVVREREKVAEVRRLLGERRLVDAGVAAVAAVSEVAPGVGLFAEEGVGEAVALGEVLAVPVGSKGDGVSER